MSGGGLSRGMSLRAIDNGAALLRRGRSINNSNNGTQNDAVGDGLWDDVVGSLPSSQQNTLTRPPRRQASIDYNQQLYDYTPQDNFPALSALPGSVSPVTAVSFSQLMAPELPSMAPPQIDLHSYSQPLTQLQQQQQQQQQQDQQQHKDQVKQDDDDDEDEPTLELPTTKRVTRSSPKKSTTDAKKVTSKAVPTTRSSNARRVQPVPVKLEVPSQGDDEKVSQVSTTTVVAASPTPRTRQAPKRAAAAISKKSVARDVDDADDEFRDSGAQEDDDDDDEEQESHDTSRATKRKRTGGGARRKPATADGSRKRGRPTRLEQDEDPDRPRLPHELSLGTLLTPPALSAEDAAALLRDMSAVIEKRDKQLEQWRAHLPAEQTELDELAPTLAAELRELRRICCATVLTVPQLALYLRLQQALINQQIKLNVLINTVNDANAAPALLLLKQPRPSIPFKGKTGHVGTFEVGLFHVRPVSKVSVTATGESSCKDFAGGTATMLQNVSKQVDGSKPVVFDNVVVNESSRMEFVHLAFRASIGGSSVVFAQPSNPMIVVTNESQWPGAAKKLLWNDTFVDEEAIPWPLFANHLQCHTVVALYSAFDRMKRPLHEWELDFFFRNARWFNRKRVISRDSALEFWQFFGPVLTALRFKRHILAMWEAGQLIGFMSKEESVAILVEQEVGTFCLRFSESVPGSFAVAYVTTDAADPIKHFLVKPSDLGHNRTLPDFLRDKGEFRLMATLVSPIDRARIKVASKDSVLKGYYKIDRKRVDADGYVNV